MVMRLRGSPSSGRFIIMRRLGSHWKGCGNQVLGRIEASGSGLGGPEVCAGELGSCGQLPC
eukprot:1588927-Rhodomonas_salina.1